MERSMKTDNPGDFPLKIPGIIILRSTIELEKFRDFNLQPQPIALPLCSSASKIAQSSWPHYEVEQITNVEKSANSTDNLFLKCNRHLL